MLLRIHEENPDPKKINTVVECLRDGGLIIYPTDTIYSLGCNLSQNKAIARVAKIKGVKPKKHDFSLVCFDLSELSTFAQVDTPVYKMMKRLLPGPYTFILRATNQVPQLFRNNKKTVGIRVPDNLITRSIVHELNYPIISTSIHDEDEILEYSTDPELIHEKYEQQVDIVIDGGYGKLIPSTVVDVTGNEPALIREGAGKFDLS